MDKLKIYTDGGARGNPGPAAGGIIIFDGSGKLIRLRGEYFGSTTNNQAEYRTLLKALQIAQRLTKGAVTCYLDSELIVKQLNGEYKVKDAKIAGIKISIDTLRGNFDSLEFSYVPREQNKFADDIVNLILDAVEKYRTQA